HTLETESTDADQDDNLPPPAHDPSAILTGPRDAMDLLGGHDSFEAAVSSNDDALLLLDDGSNESKTSGDIELEDQARDHTPTHPSVLPSGDLSLEEITPQRRGKEPSMPAIHIGTHEKNKEQIDS